MSGPSPGAPGMAATGDLLRKGEVGLIVQSTSQHQNIGTGVSERRVCTILRTREEQSERTSDIVGTCSQCPPSSNCLKA
eukprot:428176-Amphidinium_carterae.1